MTTGERMWSLLPLVRARYERQNDRATRERTFAQLLRIWCHIRAHENA